MDMDQEGMQETPGRMARAYAELFRVRPLRLTTFPNDEGYDELVVAREIPFRPVALAGLTTAASRVARMPGQRRGFHLHPLVQRQRLQDRLHLSFVPGLPQSQCATLAR
jgi:hypothetical protein